MPGSRLAVLHLHQREASLDARERLGDLASSAAPGRDLVPLLTCHRVELYAAVDAAREPLAALADRIGASDGVLDEATVLVDGEAAEHLFRVAAGLDSLVLGEGQIVGQIRRAYESARSGELDATLASLFQRALHLARTIRATTALGSVRRSIGSLAVDEALRHVEHPSSATALVVGAGEVGKLTSRALASRVGRLIVANRDESRAADLAAPIDAEVVPLRDLAAALERADLVISAADTRGSLLTRDLLKARAARRPLVLIDIAVPRSVDEDARTVPGLVYRDVDHLAGAEASAVPSETVELAALRCAEEARDFTEWLRDRESARTIQELRERGDAIRERQLARAMRRLGHLSERDREVVESLAAGLTHALLHEPTVRMRGRPDVEEAARSLFGLDGEDPSPYPGRADRGARTEVEHPAPREGFARPRDGQARTS